MLTLYGLHNCDSCRRAQRALEAAGFTIDFIDLKQRSTEHGLDDALLDRLLEGADWRTLLNRRSHTWRDLEEEERSDLDEESARALMKSRPTLIKRPVVDDGTTLIVGHDPDGWRSLIDQ
ncbi:arsenate reductase [Kushneria sinocarnis]|uniref:Arsenate reductase n=1 Tax=Kushneria sinocarnis TaxID=595502 RepID=A0A420WXK6_9GAMM|nr:ArsC/Spx/MgsR family protein [Kushneria sinocarnis]RKR04450.1 arsenate reductase [Kushneria sinocarnis]